VGIRPIQTFYDGHRFRSRLEARWAVFFNTLNIPYEYEKEGYVLDSGLGTYLPDFWLPEQDCWIEIKGTAPTGEDEERLKAIVPVPRSRLHLLRPHLPAEKYLR
jgi:hypothetical protein